MRKDEDPHDVAVHATNTNAAMAIGPLLGKRCVNAMDSWFQSRQAGGNEAVVKVRVTLGLVLAERRVQAV